MAVVVSVVQGDAANLEADTTRMGLEAVLLQVSPSVAQVADAQESTILHLVTLAFAPGALIAELVACPVPQAIDSLLDATDMPCRKSRCGRGEGVGDVAAKAAVCVGVGETTGGLEEGEAVVRELFL